jgi:hypothetical protein
LRGVSSLARVHLQSLLSDEFGGDTWNGAQGCMTPDVIKINTDTQCNNHILMSYILQPRPGYIVSISLEPPNVLFCYFVVIMIVAGIRDGIEGGRGCFSSS